MTGSPALEVLEQQRLGPVPEYVDTLHVSPKLAQIAWGRPEGGEWYLYVNEARRAGPYDALGASLRFGPEGDRLAWSGRRGEAWFVQVDDQESGPYDAVGRSGIQFSEDGAHYGFQAQVDGQWRVVVDGESLSPFEQTSPPVLAGGRVAWLGVRGDSQTVVVDGEDRGTYPEARLQTFSPDGSRFAWTARDDEGWRLIVDGSSGDQRFDLLGFVVFSPDSARIAYAAQRGDAWFIGHDRGLLGPFDDVSAPTFAPDGRLAYAAREDGAWVLHVGEWTSPPQQAVGEGSPAFAEDGGFAWWSSDEDAQRVWREDKVVATVDTVSELGVWFAGDEVAFVARDDEGWHARRGDWRSPSFHEIALVEDHAAHVGLVARDDHGWGVFVGRAASEAELSAMHASGGAGTDFGGGIEFTGEGTVRFTLMGDDGIELVTAKVP